MSESTYHKVKSLSVAGGFLDGLNIDFSNGHNCIIGGRGTGKTTVLEFIRWALDQMSSMSDASSKSRNIDRLIDANLGSGQVSVNIETKTGVSYKVQRSVSNDPLVISDSGDPVPIEIGRGNIFSIEIYSQNQIEEIADDPLFQLKLIDKFVAEEVKNINAEIQVTVREIDSYSDDIFSICKELIDLKERTSELPEVLEKLKAFQMEEGSEAADAFNKESVNKALRIKEKRSVDTMTQLFSTIANELEKIASDISDNTSGCFTEDIMKGPNAAFFNDIKSLVDGASLDVEKRIAETVKVINETENALQDKMQILRDAHLRQEKFYAEFLEQHQKEKDKSRERDTLLKKQSQLQELQARLTKKNDELVKKNTERQNLLRKLSELKDERYTLREGVATNLSSQLSPTIRVKIEPFGNTDPYKAIIEEGLRGSGLKYNAIVEKILQRIPPHEFSAIVLREDVKSLSEQLDIDIERASKVISQFKDNRRAYDIDIVDLHDKPAIELKDGPDYKNASTLSTGQKCTTILPILLLESESPLFIDQPEDNLDNAFIYETVVKSICNVKSKRQLVFITHNPNIPVLGDAESVFVLSSSGRKAELKGFGTVDDVKDEIETLLEGGKEAFQRRKERYGY